MNVYVLYCFHYQKWRVPLRNKIWLILLRRFCHWDRSRSILRNALQANRYINKSSITVKQHRKDKQNSSIWGIPIVQQILLTQRTSFSKGNMAIVLFSLKVNTQVFSYLPHLFPINIRNLVLLSWIMMLKKTLTDFWII